MNQSIHQIYNYNAQNMHHINDNSIDLVVTSPPYPMIEMWDELYKHLNPQITKHLSEGDGQNAFELMHRELDIIWEEIYRVVKNNRFICINIGDATRTINKNFMIYFNHSRIINKMLSLGFQPLPTIYWRKQTNAPNKFMGSGMLPAGAYVTLENEFILIFRKGGKREFKSLQEKELRMNSAFFWEERNKWFSDIWDVKGTNQRIINSKSRERSAAFPFEIPYRLINMYSIKGDTILDPFLGIGTTTLAALASNRNSIGIELNNDLIPIVNKNISSSKDRLNQYILKRLEDHCQFIDNYEHKKQPKYYNDFLKNKVITKQETKIKLDILDDIIIEDEKIIAIYKEIE